MLAFEVGVGVEAGVVSSDGNDRHAAASVCTTAYELVIRVFEEVMMHEKQERVCILREYTDSRVEEVVEVELARENSIRRGSGADSNAFNGSVKADKAGCGGVSSFVC